jgi:hypothetical protein
MLLLPPSTSYLRFERKFQTLKKYEGHNFHLKHDHCGLETESVLTISEFAISVTGDLVVYTKNTPNYRLIPQLKRLLHYFGYDNFYVNHKDIPYYFVDNSKTQHLRSIFLNFNEFAESFHRIHNDMILMRENMVRAIGIPEHYLFDFGAKVVALDPVYQPTYQRAIKIRGKKELRKIMCKLKDNIRPSSQRFYPRTRV